MTTINLTKDNFDATVMDNDMVVVDFWAPWCAPCRFFSPVFEATADKFPGVVFGKVNTEEQPDLAGMFGIRSIPTLMILREKVILYSEAGALPGERTGGDHRQGERRWTWPRSTRRSPRGAPRSRPGAELAMSVLPLTRENFDAAVVPLSCAGSGVRWLGSRPVDALDALAESPRRASPSDA